MSYNSFYKQSYDDLGMKFDMFLPKVSLQKLNSPLKFGVFKGPVFLLNKNNKPEQKKQQGERGGVNN